MLLVLNKLSSNMKVSATLFKGLILAVCAFLSANLLTAQTTDWQQGPQDGQYGANATGNDWLATNNTYDAQSQDFAATQPDGDAALPTDATQDTKLLECEAAVTIDGYSYAVVRVGRDCWFKENLRVSSGINDAVAYMGKAANKNKFGLLYSWQSAVSSSSSAPYVQGICPDGWAIPTVEDLQNLYANASKDIDRLKDSDPSSWNVGKCGKSPSTGFDLLGAGYYESEQNRFEELRSNTILWTSEAGATGGTAICCEFNDYSKEPMFKEISTHDKVSVRCIKKY